METILSGTTLISGALFGASGAFFGFAFPAAMAFAGNRLEDIGSVAAKSTTYIAVGAMTGVALTSVPGINALVPGLMNLIPLPAALYIFLLSAVTTISFFMLSSS